MYGINAAPREPSSEQTNGAAGASRLGTTSCRSVPGMLGKKFPQRLRIPCLQKLCVHSCGNGELVRNLAEADVNRNFIGVDTRDSYVRDALGVEPQLPNVHCVA